MIEVRWHGRGGQGAVTAASIVASAAIAEGKHAQAFPFFGPERRGAPVLAFNRINDKPIWVRTEIYKPDIVVVLDPTLAKTENVTEGLKSGGTLIINTTKNPREVKELFSNVRVATVDAKRIALDALGVSIVNTAMLGAFARVTKIVGLESIKKIIREKFTNKVAEKNIKAASRAYDEVALG